MYGKFSYSEIRTILQVFKTIDLKKIRDCNKIDIFINLFNLGVCCQNYFRPLWIKFLSIIAQCTCIATSFLCLRSPFPFMTWCMIPWTTWIVYMYYEHHSNKYCHWKFTKFCDVFDLFVCIWEAVGLLKFKYVSVFMQIHMYKNLTLKYSQIYRIFGGICRCGA